MLYYVIDAFTETKFGGNPAGVVIHQNLDENFMKKFACEMRFSETAFIKQLSNKNFEIRFFTPTNEVDLCGHATVASFKALLDCKLIQDDDQYFMKTLAGNLPVTVKNSFIMMEQAVPLIGKSFDDYNELSKIFNIDINDIGDVKFNLVPQAASTGLWDIMLPVKTKEALYKLNPNFNALSEYSKISDVGGVHAFTLDTEEGTALCRNFCPLYGIDEEAATGTSNGALTYYLYKNDVINKFNQEYSFLQGHNMGRPSIITTKLINEESPKVMVGGKAVILTKGEIVN
jgi:PhzF family phenazine biosynthesis protein